MLKLWHTTVPHEKNKRQLLFAPKYRQNKKIRQSIICLIPVISPFYIAIVVCKRCKYKFMFVCKTLFLVHCVVKACTDESGRISYKILQVYNQMLKEA